MAASIDWGAIRRRLAESEAALDAAFTIDEAEVERMMAARAQQFAARSPNADRIAATRPVLVAASGTEQFAVELADLSGIVPFRSCAPVPGGQRELLGIINTRGALWTVFDFGRLFCEASAADGLEGYVLLLRHVRRRVGIRFDNVQGVREVDSSQIKAAREGFTEMRLNLSVGPEATLLPLVRMETVWMHPAISEAA